MIPIIHLTSCQSTQDEVFARLESGLPTPFAVHADEQLQGRGRRGRSWISEKHTSLTFSLGLETSSKNLSGFSLVLGLSLIKCMREIPLQLKWPNDLMLEDSKVGGILIESRVHRDKIQIAAGFGLNLYSVGVYRGLERSLDLSKLLSQIEQDWQIFEREGFSVFREEYNSKLWRKDQKVKFLSERGEEEVLVREVDETGALLTQNSGRLELKISGEIAYVENLLC